MSTLSAILLPQNYSALYFGLIVAAGIGLCIIMLYALTSKLGGSLNEVLLCSVGGLICGALCSHICYVLFSVPEPDLSMIFDFSSGGYSVIGMLAGFCAGAALCSWIIGSHPLRLLDFIAPSAAAAISLGMLGCIWTGEYIGSPVSSNALHFFPVSVFNKAEGVWYYPLFWYMSVYSALLCAFLMILIHSRYADGTLNCRSGEIFILYAVLYCAPAGIMETFRSDAMLLNPVFLNKFHIMQTTQLCCGIVAGIGVLYLVACRMIYARFSLRSLWPLPVAALMYCGYYYDMLHIATVYDWLNTLWIIISAAGLSAVALYTFFALARERVE